MSILAEKLYTYVVPINLLANIKYCYGITLERKILKFLPKLGITYNCVIDFVVCN